MRLHLAGLPSVRLCATRARQRASRTLFAHALLALLLLAGGVWSQQASAALASCDLQTVNPTSQTGAPGTTLNYSFNVVQLFACGGNIDNLIITSDSTGGAIVTPTTTASGGVRTENFTITLGPTPGTVGLDVRCQTACGTVSIISYTATALSTPAMSVRKALTGNSDPDGSGSVTQGDVLTYTVTGTNTGNTVLNSITISDPLTTPNTVACPSLVVGATCVLIGTYTVTAADVSAGSINNTGSAVSKQTAVVTQSLSTPVFGSPAMRVSKALTNNSDPDGSGTVTQGDVLTYTVTTTNTGNIPLTNVQVNDPISTPNTTNCPNVPVGGTCVLTGIYTVSATDVSAGSISNTGNATSTQVPGPVNSNTVNTPVFGSPRMSVAKALTNNSDPDGSGSVTQGDVLTFKVTASNTGNIALTNVVVNDPLTSPNTTTCPNVPVSGTCVLTGTYMVTASDVSSGSISNTGSATSTQVPGPITSSLRTPVAGSPAMSVSKALTNNSDPDASGSVTQGDVLTFRVTASNTGNIALTNVQVNDPLTTPSTTNCPNVAVGATCVLTGTYTVTAADVSAGSISNTGNATSTQVPGPVNSATINTPVLIANGTLTILSGNNQSLAGGAASAPLVVELRNSASNPVPGATIHWSSSNGTLASATTITDAAGRSNNTATLQLAGPAAVTASSASPLAGPVSFSLNGGIAHLTGLTPEQKAVALALDNACPALAARSNRTPAEQDFLQRCQELEQAAGIDPSGVGNALTQLFAGSAFLQSTAALQISASQFDNIKARIAALRSGTGGKHFGGLALNTPNGGFPIGSTIDSLLGAADAKKPEIGAGFDRWGFFAAGTLGHGSADPGHVLPGYNFDTTGLTAGVDYRYSDSFIFGATAGYARFNSTLDGGNGHMNTRGWSLSAYSTLFHQDSWYADGVLTWGHNRYDITRRILYTLTTPTGTTTIDTRANANASGSSLAGTLTIGRDFQRGPWSIGPYFRGNLARLSFDDYRESLPAGTPGSGLGLVVKSRNVQSASSVLGGKFTYASSQSWGVLMPHIQAEWEHEFKSDPYRLEAHFLNDPTATPILVTGDAIDSDFFRLGFGLSFIFTGGKSGFIYYEKTLGRRGITQDNLALGIRLEF